MEWVLILSVGKCSEEKENNDETPLDTQTYLKLNITHVFILKFHYLSWCWLQELQEDEQHTSNLSLLAYTPILIVHNCANKSVCKLTNLEGALYVILHNRKVCDRKFELC